MTITIDKDIPLPKKRGGNKAAVRYPFEQLRVGDSFFVPGLMAAYTVPAARSEYVRRNQHHDVKFETRALVLDPVHKAMGIRVWRTR